MLEQKTKIVNLSIKAPLLPQPFVLGLVRLCQKNADPNEPRTVHLLGWDYRQVIWRFVHFISTSWTFSCEVMQRKMFTKISQVFTTTLIVCMDWVQPALWSVVLLLRRWIRRLKRLFISVWWIWTRSKFTWEEAKKPTVKPEKWSTSKWVRIRPKDGATVACRERKVKMHQSLSSASSNCSFTVVWDYGNYQENPKWDMPTCHWKSLSSASSNCSGTVVEDNASYQENPRWEMPTCHWKPISQSKCRMSRNGKFIGKFYSLPKLMLRAKTTELNF